MEVMSIPPSKNEYQQKNKKTRRPGRSQGLGHTGPRLLCFLIHVCVLRYVMCFGVFRTYPKLAGRSSNS